MLNRLHKHKAESRWMVESWILAFMSLILIGFTVDYFGKIQPLFFFTLGSIAWAKSHNKINHTVAQMKKKSKSKMSNQSMHNHAQ